MRLIGITLLLLNCAYFAYMQYFYVQAAPPSYESDLPGLAAAVSVRLVSEVTAGPLASAVPRQPPRQEVSLEQVDEPSPAQLVTDLVSNPMTVEVSGDKLASGICEAIGPFENLFQGQALVERLTAQGVNVYLKAVDTETGDRDYRVMLSPSASAAAAFRLLRELKAQNIDSYVISKGKDAMAISLGVFSTRAAALKLEGNIQGRGYVPQIKAIIKYERRFWIFALGTARLNMAPEIWHEISASEPSVGQEKRACPDVTAGGEQNK